MSLGLAAGRVVLARSHTEWAAAFAEARAALQAAIPVQALAIEHVGSTAVPGLPAKPILDILVGVRSAGQASACVAPLTALGYRHRGEYGIPGRQYFIKGEPRTQHVHIVEVGSDTWKRTLLFRDLLRLHAGNAAEYADEKQRLAAAHPFDRGAYQHGKDRVIERLIGHAHAVGAGRSGAAVYRLAEPGAPARFLKTADADDAAALEAEHARLCWLQGRAPVAGIVGFDRSPGHVALLTTALPGTDATQVSAAGRAHVVAGFGRVLRALHSIPVTDCPFDQSLDVVIEQARARTAQGRVDESDFDDERKGQRAQDMFGRLERERPGDETPVVTHGDASLVNVICDGDRVSGLVDCCRVGLADAYQDLAIASRSIANRYGAAHVAAFFDAYGLRAVDDSRLSYYRLVDEFF